MQENLIGLNNQNWLYQCHVSEIVVQITWDTAKNYGVF